MLYKETLEISNDPSLGFYSRSLLVEKASGGWRPVIDIFPLNKFIQQTPFKMETASSVLNSVEKDNFMALVDLKDMYFQMPTHKAYLKCPHFICQRTVYQFKVFSFGFFTTSQVFTRVFTVMSLWVHSCWIHSL